jgi:diaminopimelate decarboxylase
MSTVPAHVLRAGVDARGCAYVYDLATLRRRCADVVAIPVPGKRVFFATMANDHPEVLDCIRRCGLGVFVNSLPHLELVLDLGFPPDRIVYAASNMTADELRHCIAWGVHLVLDSLGQLQDFLTVGGGSRVGLRVNVGSALDRRALSHDPDYRFGVLPEELPTAVALAADAGVRIAGVHSYFGTDLMDPRILLAGLERLARAAADLPDLDYVDVGGGFGVPDAVDQPVFDLDYYGTRAAAVVDRLSRQVGRPIALHIEPGRYLVAGAGWFFVKVVDCKIRDDRVFVGTNGSVANFPRPLLYPDRARHECELIPAVGGARGPLRRVSVCGNSTYSQDFLARDVQLPLPCPGDTLVFHNAGAYGRSMTTRFLGREPAEEIVLAPSDAVAASR